MFIVCEDKISHANLTVYHDITHVYCFLLPTLTLGALICHQRKNWPENKTTNNRPRRSSGNRSRSSDGNRRRGSSKLLYTVFPITSAIGSYNSLHGASRDLSSFLANVNSRSRSLYAIARPSVCRLSSVCLSVCNVRAPYSGG